MTQCSHSSISGEHGNRNWVCNICLYEEGNPTQWAKGTAKMMQKRIKEFERQRTDGDKG